MCTNKTRMVLLATGFIVLLAAVVSANFDEGWPREAEFPEARVVMYQPQIEQLTENDIECRAAVSVTLKGETEPRFGAIWMKARLEIDRSERLVSMVDITVDNVRFPEADAEHEQKLARFLETQITEWRITDSLDRLIAALAVAEHEEPRDQGFKNDPPQIIVENEAATLVLLDGEPKKIAVTTPSDAVKKGIERVVNTPSYLYYAPKKKTWYVFADGIGWYQAKHFKGPWKFKNKPPKAIRALTPKGSKAKATTGNPVEPKIIVSTEPVELIVIFGDLKYAPLGEQDLLYVTNTESDIIMDAEARRHYVLMSGRWFSSGELLQGPWSHVAHDQLPDSFASIPAESAKGHMRAQIAGTIEAKEAVLNNLIPQTSAIQRMDGSLKVSYDGEPKFEPIEGTAMKYAVNSPQSVILAGSTYYCCEQGVWYESASPTGSWKVCTVVAEEIYDIPPSSPVYNVTYVKVYEATPEVVYVGYTPGYVGSYYSHGCVVYGTGWYYPGWYGRHYYPRPSTWGFHASYNPWTGWGFGVSWTNGPLMISIGGYPHYYSSWWGPWGYRPYYPPRYPGYRPPHYPRPPVHYPPAGGARPPVGGTRPPASGARPSQLPSGASARPASNIYSKPANAARNVHRPTTGAATRPATTVGTRPNNVYTDRSGNVYRRSQGGWESRQGGSWNGTPQAGTRPSQPSAGARPSQPSTRPSTRPSQPSSLNRDYGARSRGNTRSQQYRSSSRPSTSRASAPRSSSRPSGGGRRR